MDDAIYRSLVQTPSSCFQPDDCSEFFTKVKQPLPRDLVIMKMIDPKKKKFEFNQKALTTRGGGGLSPSQKKKGLPPATPSEANTTTR